MNHPTTADSLTRAWIALMEGNLDATISETQWGSGDHRLLCALARAIQRHHSHHLNAWMNTPQLVFRGKTPRTALLVDAPHDWYLLRRALTAEADRLRNEEINELLKPVSLVP